MAVQEQFAPISSTTYSGNASDFAEAGYVHSLLKRLLDLAISIPALLLFAPLLGVLAILIRTGSEGPAVFRQTRLGLYGTPFQILKFRTMTVLEDGPVIQQASKNDARVTKVGNWMRRLSLDELPQLINVINGEMSLIGPRPHALAHDRHYGRAIGGYDLRQLVKPGISGWAQVHGHRGATMTTSNMRERLAYDVWYSKNATFVLDLKIIACTLREVLGQRNAY